MTDSLLHIGGRDEQQDACNVFKNSHSILLALGDGMGGHSGGKVASETLISEAEYAYTKQKGIIKNPKEFFQGIVDGTMSALAQYVEENPNSDPHTTCVLALIQNNKLFVGHIGDSRMYLFINKKFEKRSRDHSVVQMLLNEGEITEEEMATHPDQNKLLKSISTRKEVKITFKEYDLPPEKSNAILICSDGLWEQISIKEMEEQLFSRPLNEAINAMVIGASNRGGQEGDNVSAAIYTQKGSILALTRNIMTKRNILAVIATMLIAVGIGYYLKPTPKLSKDENTTKIKVHQATSPVKVNKNNKIKESNDLNNDKVIVNPIKDDHATQQQISIPIEVNKSNRIEENNDLNSNKGIISPIKEEKSDDTQVEEKPFKTDLEEKSSSENKTNEDNNTPDLF